MTQSMTAPEHSVTTLSQTFLGGEDETQTGRWLACELLAGSLRTFSQPWEPASAHSMSRHHHALPTAQVCNGTDGLHGMGAKEEGRGSFIVSECPQL